jgi:uncharacterized membrane protein
MGFLKLRAPDGRRWTLREWVQGHPIRHPTHPMFVHFPVAFYLAVVVFDVMTRITPSSALVLAGTYLLIGAFLGSAAAAVTGLIDWLGMIPGSSKRRLATQHMLLQVTALVVFLIIFIMRWGDRTLEQAQWSWIILALIGYGILAVGQFLGGILVYDRGMRVRTGGAAPDQTPDAN